MAPSRIIADILDSLRRAGFPLVGTCSARVEPSHQRALDLWVEGGLHGRLAYMARDAERRKDPRHWLEWARSVICVAIPYDTRPRLDSVSRPPGRAWVSRYAWGRDYHKVLPTKLRPAVAALKAAGHRARLCVDVPPLMERYYAWRAGLGFIGKNTMLIHPELGSTLFLGEILTDLELPEGQAMREGCGGCALCLKACPTGAFPEPLVLDARKCLSTWTIEARGSFTEETPPLHGHLFGCDRCQEVCPYNPSAPASLEPDFEPRTPWLAPDPKQVASMTVEEWDAATNGTALRRARYDGLIRNARRILEEKDLNHRGAEAPRKKSKGKEKDRTI